MNNDNLLLMLLRKVFKKKILNHRLIFCINPGRSGSKYLSELLDTAKGVKSYHEPEPKMIGNYLKMVTDYPREETFYERKVKSIAIKNKLISFKRNQVYCETSHMFIKTFYDVILNDFKNVEVITLRRNIVSVLKSFIECGYFSDKNYNWPKWMHSIEKYPNAFCYRINKKKLDQYDLSISYLIDMEYRAVLFQNKYPWIKNIQVNLEDLNRLDYVKALFRDLNITPTDNTKMIVNSRLNSKEKMKINLGNATSLNYCNERLEEHKKYIDNKDIFPSDLYKIVVSNLF